MLLLHSVEIEEQSQKPEIAALLLLGSAGGIVFATANDLLERRDRPGDALADRRDAGGAESRHAPAGGGVQVLRAGGDLGGRAAVRDRAGLHGDGLVRLADARRRRPGLPLAAAGRHHAGRARVRLRAGAGPAPLRRGGRLHGRRAGPDRLRDGGEQGSGGDRAEPPDRLDEPGHPGGAAAALDGADRDRADLDRAGARWRRWPRPSFGACWRTRPSRTPASWRWRSAAAPRAGRPRSSTW